jgi:hypothetical protein
MKNKIINLLLILTMSIFMVSGCSTTQKKADNNTAKIELVSKISYQQKAELSNNKQINMALVKIYNADILNVVGEPLSKAAKKDTNFVVEMAQVKTDSYKIDKTLENELIVANAELKEYHSKFGVTAIWLGIKQLSHWIIGSTLALTGLVIIMRLLSGSSPIIAAIWSVISNILGWLINQLALICPKLLDSIKNTEQEVVADWKKLWTWGTSIFRKKPLSVTIEKL